MFQKDRQNLLDKAKNLGWISGYSSIRVHKSGKLFQIVNGELWNLWPESGDDFNKAGVVGPQVAFIPETRLIQE